MLSLRYYNSDKKKQKKDSYISAKKSANLPFTCLPNNAIVQSNQYLHQVHLTAKVTKPPNADNEDTDQTARMDRMIRVLIGHIVQYHMTVYIYTYI